MTADLHELLKCERERNDRLQTRIGLLEREVAAARARIDGSADCALPHRDEFADPHDREVELFKRRALRARHEHHRAAAEAAGINPAEVHP